MANKLGILIAGLNGAIGSTVAASLDLISRGLRPKSGMICELPNAKGITLATCIGVPELTDIAISGWDITDLSLKNYLSTHRVLRDSDINVVSEETLTSRAMLAPQQLDFRNVEGYPFGSRIEKLCQDIKKFRLDNSLESVVVVNCIPTQPTLDWSTNYDSLQDFQLACARLDHCITPSMEYACAAILESAAFVNFTPNLAVIPALEELALAKGVPLAGRDGKTGQTLFKTAIAPTLKLRGLLVKGWYSINILGNKDGESLSEPDACNTKVKSKESSLEKILGYPVEDHQVHIHYYRPRGDDKEAWDNIDIEGFLGYPMQLKLNFLGRDSILAAPLIIDLARLMSVAMRRGESGLLPQLSVFFKQPEVLSGQSVEHDLFVQREMFEEWVNRCCQEEANINTQQLLNHAERSINETAVAHS